MCTVHLQRKHAEMYHKHKSDIEILMRKIVKLDLSLCTKSPVKNELKTKTKNYKISSSSIQIE